MYKLYSQRKKEQEENVKDVYIYDKFPKAFRNQYLKMVDDVFWGNDYIKFEKSFCREKGLKSFGDRAYCNAKNRLEYYVDYCDEKDFLDLLDFTFAYYFEKLKEKYEYSKAITLVSKELNNRFTQHSLGYELINGQIIEKTNEHIHREIVKPSIVLLNNPEFSGAEQEYFEGFECLKKGEYKNAITNANKAFESVMKTICSGMGYEYNKTEDSSKKLINILENNEFYPSYLNNFITKIRAMLESGAPTIRNKTSAHGQGEEVIEVSKEYAEYAMNLVATNIVFLVKLYNEKKAEK